MTTRLLSLFNKKAVSEMIKHFQNLIKINTTNPPGGETKAARYIGKVFKAEGIQYKILENEKGRGNIIARIKGDGSERPLLLMGHLDVVAVEEEHWDHDPFKAEIDGEHLWGRGTLDCKNSVTLWMMIMLLIKRSKITPKRDVIFLATADEEEGHVCGMEWLVKDHYELIDAEAALNEGGGFGIDFMGNTFYTCQNAEKGNIWLRITARGNTGHASIPTPDNSLLKITELANRLASQRFPMKVTPAVQEMINTMSALQSFPTSFVFRQLTNPLLSGTILSLPIMDDSIASSFRSMLHNTICPTVLHAGQKTNIIPSEASLEIDFRLLPGYQLEDMLRLLYKLIGENFEIKVLDARPATESTWDHPLISIIDKKIQAEKAMLTPFLLPGVTDGCFLRPRGVKVYGFTPLLPKDDISLAHGHNERISLDSIEFSLRLGLEVVSEFIMQ